MTFLEFLLALVAILAIWALATMKIESNKTRDARIAALLEQQHDRNCFLPDNYRTLFEVLMTERRRLLDAALAATDPRRLQQVAVAERHTDSLDDGPPTAEKLYREMLNEDLRRNQAAEFVDPDTGQPRIPVGM